MKLKQSLFATLGFTSLIFSGFTACAAQPAYNPDSLGSSDFSRVSNICQTVMGLSPAEALAGGYWMGNERLDYWTSKYRGCIVSLSDSLQTLLDTQTAARADANCRAKGFDTGSPDLALCVLRSINGPTAPGSRGVTATPVSEKEPIAGGSYTYASPRETARREQAACAALGFEPGRDTFKSCVKGLSDTFYAIDHPIL